MIGPRLKYNHGNVQSYSVNPSRTRAFMNIRNFYNQRCDAPDDVIIFENAPDVKGCAFVQVRKASRKLSCHQHMASASKKTFHDILVFKGNYKIHSRFNSWVLSYDYILWICRQISQQRNRSRVARCEMVTYIPFDTLVGVSKVASKPSSIQFSMIYLCSPLVPCWCLFCLLDQHFTKLKGLWMEFVICVIRLDSFMLYALACYIRLIFVTYQRIRNGIICLLGQNVTRLTPWMQLCRNGMYLSNVTRCCAQYDEHV